MGEDENPPNPPELGWSVAPTEQAIITKRLTRANWAQVFEGGIDSSHGRFLHRGTITQREGSANRDTFPVYEALDTDYGSLIAARHGIPGESKSQVLWRVYQFLLPFYTMVPRGSEAGPLICHAFVPRDDESTMVWSATWHPDRAIDPSRDLAEGSAHATLHVREFRAATGEADSAWVPIASRENDYLLDWNRQKKEAFSGIPGIALQDAAMQESMGAIFNRENEHFGSADMGILHVRRVWMELARSLEGLNGRGELPGVRCPERYRVRSFSLLLEKGESWIEAAHKYQADSLGVR
jgi:phthalate 4,5-dioxygenase oxygenase subunit